MKRITVYYEGEGLSISQSVAELFGLCPEQVINDEKLFWEVIEASSREGLAECEEKLIIQGVERWLDDNEAARSKVIE